MNGNARQLAGIGESRERGAGPRHWLLWAWLKPSLLIAFLCSFSAAEAGEKVGEIVSALGTVEVLRDGRWHAVEPGDQVAAAAVVRTGSGSRAAVQLTNGTQLKLNANSRLELKAITPQAQGPIRASVNAVRNILRVLSGEVWIRNSGEPLEIRTMPATATVRGTEFNLAVERDELARLAVLEGLVELSNPQGRVLVAANEQATAKLGEAPRKTVLLNPLDAVQWTLYYPGQVSYRDYPLTSLASADLQERADALERRLTSFPQDADALVELGEVSFDLGKRKEAQAAFEQALRLVPTRGEARTGLGWIHLEGGEPEAALEEFRRAKPASSRTLAGEALALYQLGRLDEAQQATARAKQRFPNSPLPETQAALNALVRGEPERAKRALDRALALDPNSGVARGLQSNIYLVQNRKQPALDAAEQAIRANPSSPSAYLALSLAEQADFELDSALEAVRKAVELDPENPQARIQEARLLFGMGRTREAYDVAKEARRLAPKDSMVESTWGFILLARNQVDEAIAAFEEAIALDTTRGEPHLGLGLALFRRNRTEEAVAELRKASLLESQVSLYQSYLGKTFYEVKDDPLAEKLLNRAKQLDPRDPTPFFYDAIRLQSINRPVEALEDLQQSIAVNDNRAVYRSRLLLDEDLAARSASLARIYDNLGFDRLARLEATKSLTLDPSNFSAHRFLADSYANQPRYEIARVSELLQSQLLQPLNITPIQPQLTQTNLFVLEGAGPATPSLNEFNPLFARNRFTLQASGVVGGNNTFGDEITLTGVHDVFSYSLGQFHYETDGFRPNNDLETDIYTAFAQYSLAPQVNVQVELRSERTEAGDLREFSNPGFQFENLRQEHERDTARAGLHWSLEPGSDLLASLAYHEVRRDAIVQGFSDTRDVLAEFNLEFLEPLLPDGRNVFSETKNDVDAKTFEFQYIKRWDQANILFGGRYIEQDRLKKTRIGATPTSPLSPSLQQDLENVGIPPDEVVVIIDAIHDLTSETLSEEDSKESQLGAYLYSTLKPLDNLQLTVGASVQSLDRNSSQSDELDSSDVHLNPKIGAVWEPFTNTRLRAAWLKRAAGPTVSEQTIEPTQVAGFNQLFQDGFGAQFERYGLGVDQRFSPQLRAGLEATWRDIEVPLFITGDRPATEEIRQEEAAHRAYFYWTPTSRTAVSAQYFYEEFERRPLLSLSNGTPIRTKLHRVPLSIGYFHPRGLFARLTATYVDQDVVLRDDATESGSSEGGDRFWVTDVSVGYRLPRRYGILTLGVKNLFDEVIQFQDASPNLIGRLEGELLPPLFAPERLIFGQVTLAF